MPKDWVEVGRLPYHPLLARQMENLSLEPVLGHPGLRLLLHAVDAAYRRQDEFRASVDSMQDMLLILDGDLRIVAACGRLLGRLGFSAGEAAGMRLDDLVKDLASRPDRDRALAEAFAGRDASFEWSAEIRGATRTFETTFGCCPSGPGDPARIACVTRDRTGGAAERRERGMLEVRLRHAQKLEAVGRLAAGLSHEINTPAQYVRDNLLFLMESFGPLESAVRTIAALARYPMDGVRDGEVREMCRRMIERDDFDFLIEEIPRSIEQALEGVRRVTAIVRSMKEFSNGDSGDRVPADVRQSIVNTVAVSRNHWKHVSVVDVDVASDLPPIPCVVEDLNHVFLNLILNAADAILERNRRSGLFRLGTIRITGRCLGDCVEIRVSDTGTGIPEEVGDRVFDPFFTTKAVGTGLGQGLAIAHHVIVTKHGGSIRFESVPDEGTTFIVQLPLAGEEDRAAA